MCFYTTPYLQMEHSSHSCFLKNSLQRQAEKCCNQSKTLLFGSSLRSQVLSLIDWLAVFWYWYFVIFTTFLAGVLVFGFDILVGWLFWFFVCVLLCCWWFCLFVCLFVNIIVLYLTNKKQSNIWRLGPLFSRHIDFHQCLSVWQMRFIYGSSVNDRTYLPFLLITGTTCFH